eukprot:351809-Chlamydomonas_euryale.AAC.5
MRMYRVRVWTECAGQTLTATLNCVVPFCPFVPGYPYEGSSCWSFVGVQILRGMCLDCDCAPDASRLLRLYTPCFLALARDSTQLKWRPWRGAPNKAALQSASRPGTL